MTTFILVSLNAYACREKFANVLDHLYDPAANESIKDISSVIRIK